MFGGGQYGAGGGPGGFVSGGGFQGAGQSKMMFAQMDDEEDDFDEEDYYDEEEYDDEGISMTESEFTQLQMEQQRLVQQQAKAQSMSYQGPGSKPVGSSLYGGAAGMGAMGSMGGAGGFQPGAASTFQAGAAGAFQAGGGTQFGASTIGGGGGGFTYGMASSAGSVFGAPAAGAKAGAGLGGGTSFGGNSSAIGGTSFGANSSAISGGAGTQFGAGSGTAALFNFGGASQFGGMGGGAGTFQSGAPLGGLGGGAPSNDPYANIELDLTKVKAAPVASKPFEKKSEEEKQKDAEQRGSIKSNLKTTKADFDKAAENKKEVRFGKSTTYEMNVDSDDSTLFNKADMGKDGKGSPRPTKKVVKETDLSDGRDEQDRIKEQLEKDKAEQIKEMEMMKEWKKKQEEKEKEGSAGNSVIDKMRMDLARKQNDMEDSAGSSSLSLHKPISSAAKSGVEESYTTDEFDDVSISGSGQLSGPKKIDFKSKSKVEDSLKSSTDGYSVSNSKSLGDLKSNSRIGESSDVYEDEIFDSYQASKSQKDMNKALPVVKKLATLKSIGSTTTQASKPFVKQVPTAISSIAQTYTRKENKQTMTDQGKYSYMGAEDAAPNNLREFTLKKNLEEAEHLIQELKSLRAEDRENVRELEIKLTKKDGDYQSSRRDALGQGETVKSLRDQLVDTKHKNDLYKIETERLIKEIDMADAKTREKENDLVLGQAEFDRKLKLVEERMLYRRGKTEDRTMLDLKQEHALTIETLKQSNDDKQETIDYQNEKINKMDARLTALTLAKDQKGEVKKLEAQVAMYQGKIEEYENVTKVKTDFSSCKGNLSSVQQVELQKEIAQFSRIIDGLNEENQRAEAKIRDLNYQVKQSDKKLAEEKKVTVDLQLRQMLEKKKVYVEGEAEEVDIQTANLMGPENSISQKQLKELQDKVNKLVIENDELKRDWVTKESTLKSLNQQVRAEKSAVEKQLYEQEFLVGQRNQEIMRMRDQNMQERALSEGQIRELEEKVTWFRDNQKILGEQQQTITTQNRELHKMQSLKKQAEEDRAKYRDLEKKCKLLEETIKARNPNSIPMLIQATTEVQKADDDDRGKKQLKYRIQQLEAELEDRDKDFERRIRSLRQEQERMRQIYEQRAANPHEAKKVNELEEELQKQKAYYIKRIKELEEKYRYGGAPTVTQKPKPQGEDIQIRSKITQEEADNLYRTIAELENTVEKLTKERNHFAQKLVQHQSRMDGGATSQISPVKNDVTCDGVEDMTKAASPAQNISMPNRNARLNPFFIEEKPSPQLQQVESGRQRSIPQLMQVLQGVNMRQFVGRHLKTAQVYQALQGAINVDEIKAIKEFISTKKQGTTIDPDDSAATIDRGSDFLDMDDLIEAIQLKHNLDNTPPMTGNNQQHYGPSSAELESLQRKIGRILREKDDDAEFYGSKIRQLKRSLKEADMERGELQEQVDRLTQNKQRLEKFYKDKMGITMDGTQTMAENLQKTKTGELMGEVGIMAKRIEYLEEQAEARTKLQHGDHGPCRREIARLTEEIQQERSSRTILIGKKNAEISYFKSELDGLLSEMMNSTTGSSSAKNSNYANSPPR